MLLICLVAIAACYVVSAGSPDDRVGDRLFTARPFRLQVEQGSSVSFFCQATAHWFTGTSRTIQGSFAASGGNLVDTAPNELRLPADTLVTGIGMRDRLMGELLRVDQHPDIVFAARTFEVLEAYHASRRYRVLVTGDLTIRGVTREEEIETELTVYDRTTKITGSHDLDIRDYQIEPPVFLGIVKVKSNVTVKWSIEASIAILPLPTPAPALDSEAKTESVEPVDAEPEPPDVD